MANNRMFLVHIPTGLAACLGKRMGWGWYIFKETEEILGGNVARLFEVLEHEYAYGEGKQDDFAVALEDANGATLATDNWKYGPIREDGLVQLVMEPMNGEMSKC